MFFLLMGITESGFYFFSYLQDVKNDLESVDTSWQLNTVLQFQFHVFSTFYDCLIQEIDAYFFHSHS